MPHLSYTFIALTLLSCNTASFSQKQLISTPNTLNCCAIFHVQVSDPYYNVGSRILFFKALFTSMDTFLPLITLASDLMTHIYTFCSSLLLCLPFLHVCIAYLNFYTSSILSPKSTSHLPCWHTHPIRCTKIHHLCFPPFKNYHLIFPCIHF